MTESVNVLLDPGVRARAKDLLQPPHFFAGLRRQHYRLIYVDPPTQFRAGTKHRPQHYKRMSDHEIAAMPVADLMHPDGCWIALWVCSPNLYKPMKSKKRLRPDEIADRWGARYSARGWIWIKTLKGQPALFAHPKNLHRGQGMTTAKNAEDILLFKKGKPPIQSRAGFEILIAPRGEHSQKPVEMYPKLEQFAQGPCVELFARGDGTQRAGWDYWGDEIGKFRR